jgi:maleylpyruvate isomerase
MKLYNYFRSSASYRVRIGLEVKGLSFEYIPIHLLRDGGDQHKPSYKAELNAMAQVPVLEVADELGSVVRLTQSVAILEYLNERWPDPPLLPSEPLARARVRSCVEIINSGIQPLHNLGVMADIRRLGGDDKTFAREAINRGLLALEAEAKRFSGEYLVGDSLSLADVFLVPQMFGARRFQADLSLAPTLVTLDKRLCELDPFQKAHPERQPDFAA